MRLAMGRSRTSCKSKKILEKESESGRAAAFANRINTEPLPNIEERLALDFFAGTRRVANVLEEQGFGFFDRGFRCNVWG